MPRKTCPQRWNSGAVVATCPTQLDNMRAEYLASFCTVGCRSRVWADMEGRDVTKGAWDTSVLPIYGCLTGIEIPNDRVEVLPGMALRRVYVDTFGTTMMAFAPPPAPKSHHPTPWAAVRGGFIFEGRVEVELTGMNAFDGLTPSAAIWLIAAVLRLRIPTPIRLAVVGNMPFDKMSERWQKVQAVAFESAQHQIGTFTAMRVMATDGDLSWLRDVLPTATRLYHEERFFRAFSVYDQAQWTPTPEMGTVLVWTAIEILFDLAGEREKTRVICRALSDYVGTDQSDRDRAYQAIKSLYYKRGRTVHAGRRMASQDVIQSFRLASVAFQRVLAEGRLPQARKETVH